MNARARSIVGGQGGPVTQRRPERSKREGDKLMDVTQSLTRRRSCYTLLRWTGMAACWRQKHTVVIVMQL